MWAAPRGRPAHHPNTPPDMSRPGSTSTPAPHRVAEAAAAFAVDEPNVELACGYLAPFCPAVDEAAHVFHRHGYGLFSAEPWHHHPLGLISTRAPPGAPQHQSRERQDDERPD